MRTRVTFIVMALLLGIAGQAVQGQTPFEWNKEVPLKKPGANDNGKLVLFDVSHGGTQGAADWVIDGAFSDFADALVADGFTVGEYRGVDKNNDGIYTFVDDRIAANADGNEAIISYDAINHAAVFVMAETNRPLRVDEYAALKQFVDDGKGIYFVSDHYNADRNLNTWDSTEVFNGYNRSDLDRYNMPAPYGDFRNPKDPTKGWLAENFGVRFRFNAVDWKPGVSGIVDPDQSEGLTHGVGSILTAGGATLAIVDATKAKGIVYFSSDDEPKSWSHAVEGPNQGLYFGGLQEGPYVAISKPSKGKAAFIGDSSPIEDKLGRYVREESGTFKSLHNGWNDPGNAAQLSLKIVRWLATTEDYVGFNSAEHPPGFSTPQPMADIEKIDPHNGQPWKDPSGGYDPWNPATFANGSYGAKFPRTPGGTLPPGDPIAVAVALALPNNQNVKVIGKVVEKLNEQFGLKLADQDDPSKSLAVQLPARFRDDFSPVLNPAVLNKTIVIAGRRNRYTGLPGLKSVQAIQLHTPGGPVLPSALARAPGLATRKAAKRKPVAMLRRDAVPFAAPVAANAQVLDPTAPGVFVRVVDVGAGLCCIVKVNDDNGSHFMIYDTGNFENSNAAGTKFGLVAFSQIRSLVPGGHEIEWVVQSHEDSDHIAATPQICQRYKVKNFLRTGFYKKGTVRKNARQAIKKEVATDGARDWVQTSPTKRMKLGHQFSLGEARLTLLSGFGKPFPQWNKIFKQMEYPDAKKINSVSIVLRLDYKGRSILFTGDAVGKRPGSSTPIATEEFLLSKQAIPGRHLKSDVIMVAHHGANNASSAAFIKAVKPRFVIFSAGEKHGHPRWATVRRYLNEDSVRFLFRTDLGDRRRSGEWNWRSKPRGFDPPNDDHVDIALTPVGRAYVYYADPEKRAFAVAD